MKEGRVAITGRTPMIDGLVFSCDGWSEALDRSHLSAVHVTVADFLGGFESTCSGIAEWHRILERDRAKLFHIRTSEDLRSLAHESRLGVIFGLQNSLAVGDDLRRVEQLWQLGVRVLQFTYNTANAVADGCLESRNGGLTNFGRQLVRECNAVGMVIDLSHGGERASLEVAEITAAPVVSTHSNISELAPSPRNKSEKVLQAIVDTGGFVGLSPYGPMCWDMESRQLPTSAAFLAQISRAIELFGSDHVSIGTDYGASRDRKTIDQVLGRSADLFPEIFGKYVESFGNDFENRYCRGLGTIESWASFPSILAESGLSEGDINKVVGENISRVFSDIWSRRNLKETEAACK
jgi:membrane dipeptidase